MQIRCATSRLFARSAFLTLLASLVAIAAAGCAERFVFVHPPFVPEAAPQRHIERVTTIAPFPRGLAMVGDEMAVLCRGRVRGVGGVSAQINDQAGTIYLIDPTIGQPITEPYPSDTVQTNGRVLARPTSPPFRLWDRSANPPESDRNTDRPYCTLRYHEPTHSLYLCAFSGIDKNRTEQDRVAFSKNRSDALLRYDLRTNTWHDVERHDAIAGTRYPHHDPATNAPPHGWLDGPDNCCTVTNTLYAVAKENSLLVAYDLSSLIDDPHAPPPSGEVILGPSVPLARRSEMELLGDSMLAHHDGYLYVGYRTSSAIIRLPLDRATGRPIEPLVAELVARFDPYDPITGRTPDLTDMSFDDAGRLYVVSAKPARVFRFTPDPDDVYDARGDREPPWVDLAGQTGNPHMKSENVLYHDGWLYVTSGDGYDHQAGADGTVYRVRVDD